jgi:hypothetical protein
VHKSTGCPWMRIVRISRFGSISEIQIAFWDEFTVFAIFAIFIEIRLWFPGGCGHIEIPFATEISERSPDKSSHTPRELMNYVRVRIAISVRNFISVKSSNLYSAAIFIDFHRFSNRNCEIRWKSRVLRKIISAQNPRVNFLWWPK